MQHQEKQSITSSCPACHQTGFKKLESIELSKQHINYAPDDVSIQQELTKEAGVEKYHMLRCRQCGLEYMHPLIAPSVRWYSIAYGLLNLYPSDRWEFDYVLDRVKPDSFLLEFASGSGYFLRKCAQRNIQAHGLDFEPDAINQCREEGLSASLLDVTQAGSIPAEIGKTPAVAVAFHILEHLAEPAQLFEAARSATSDNAEMWVSVPSNLRPSRLFKKKDFLDQPPHHMTRWTPEALRLIGKTHGWEMVECTYEPLALKDKLWSYSHTFPLARQSNKRVEQLTRVITYPLAALKMLRAKHEMSGHTMLAHYRKV